MQIVANLDQAEKLTVIYKCLTTGLPFFCDYGFELDYKPSDYAEARISLTDAGKTTDEICLEDVQIEIIRLGYGLTFTDVEGEGDNTKTLTLAMIEENWDKIPAKYIIEMMVDENWDANTADCIMQYILFGELVYG